MHCRSRRTAARRLRAGRRPAKPREASAPGWSPALSPHGAPDAAHVVEILSHELRSPITTIHLGAKVLRDASGMPPPVRDELVAAVEEDADRLYRLVEDLLAVARHEDGRATLPVGPLLLQRWLGGVIDAEVQATPGLRVRVSLPPGLPPVLADDGGLAQVVGNLLRNANRYATSGMPVEVVGRSPRDGILTVDVLDRGPGFTLAEAALLFEPFYRSDAARAIGSGAGLGLAAGRRLLRAMGGDVHAYPRSGGGARFAIRLRVAQADEDAEVETAAQAGAGTDPPPLPG